MSKHGWSVKWRSLRPHSVIESLRAEESSKEKPLMNYDWALKARLLTPKRIFCLPQLKMGKEGTKKEIQKPSRDCQVIICRHHFKGDLCKSLPERTTNIDNRRCSKRCIPSWFFSLSRLQLLLPFLKSLSSRDDSGEKFFDFFPDWFSLRLTSASKLQPAPSHTIGISLTYFFMDSISLSLSLYYFFLCFDLCRLQKKTNLCVFLPHVVGISFHFFSGRLLLGSNHYY